MVKLLTSDAFQNDRCQMGISAGSARLSFDPCAVWLILCLRQSRSACRSREAEACQQYLSRVLHIMLDIFWSILGLFGGLFLRKGGNPEWTDVKYMCWEDTTGNVTRSVLWQCLMLGGGIFHPPGRKRGSPCGSDWRSEFIRSNNCLVEKIPH